MRKLLQGIHRFQQDRFGAQRELFERLADGQHPQAVFVACSDSRIDPNLITQTEPGDLFVLRNAGNIVPRHNPVAGGEEASIEFALRGLGVKDIIVCGHSHCGAVNASLSPQTVQDSMPAVFSWLAHAQSAGQAVAKNNPGLSHAELLNIAVQANVLLQLENLRTHPPVAKALEAGEVSLHGWVYKFETGQVFAFDPLRGRFVDVGDAETSGGPGQLGQELPQLCAI